MEMEMVYDTSSETVYQRSRPQTPYEQSTSIWAKLHEETGWQYKEMRDRYAKDMIRQQQVITEASKPLPALGPAPDKTRDIGATLDTCEKQHQREHIWNMIVLAAESSRYNT